MEAKSIVNSKTILLCFVMCTNATNYVCAINLVITQSILNYEIFKQYSFIAYNDNTLK